MLWLATNKSTNQHHRHSTHTHTTEYLDIRPEEALHLGVHHLDGHLFIHDGEEGVCLGWVDWLLVGR